MSIPNWRRAARDRVGRVTTQQAFRSVWPGIISRVVAGSVLGVCWANREQP